MLQPGGWVFLKRSRQIGRIVEAQNLWDRLSYRIWVPASDSLVRVPHDAVETLKSADFSHYPHYLTYVAAGGRILDALNQNLILSPIEASIIPLPHQIRAVMRAVEGDRVRYLLADEVGLGKTIEAGLILRELKLRGLVRRILVIVPKGLVTQWVSEMFLHFQETFHFVLPDDLKTLSRFTISAGSSQEMNPWNAFPQVITALDSVKPLLKKRGWPASRIAEYNRERFESLISAAWDLVIVDEAHRLAGSTDQVARYKLGRGIAEAAPYILMLSATPHQGKTDAFHRLMNLLDADAFPDAESTNRDRVQPYVIRTAKRMAIDAEGLPLFQPRNARLIPVAWGEQHKRQQALYDAVTEYVREGYNQAIREKKPYLGFLMILMQRLVTSSTHAIRATLARRLEALHTPEEQLSLFPSILDEEWADMDAQEQIDALLSSRLKALKNERAEVRLLLEESERTEAYGPDVKAEALLDWIYKLQQEEADPEIKILIFTEFVPTQEMLRSFLTERGFSVTCLNGSMGMTERTEVQKEFAGRTRILISTDAGGEGLNLQFCHVVINYDIPWNPMKLEQRIGRVDRIGQAHPVRAVHFVIEDTVEFRVRTVLEDKLKVILEEFGVDKTGDILDSAQSGEIFDALYAEAIVHPDRFQSAIDSALEKVAREASAIRESPVAPFSEQLDPEETHKMISHPLPFWVEQMVVAYVNTFGGSASRDFDVWRIRWPDGKFQTAVFSSTEMQRTPEAEPLTLQNLKILGLAQHLPPFAEGQPVPVLSVIGIPETVTGLWSLWRISAFTPDWNRQKVFPIFLHGDGRLLVPTARAVWDQVLSAAFRVVDCLSENESLHAFQSSKLAAEESARTIYAELLNQYTERMMQERERKELAFAARRRAIERLGLDSVRGKRLALLSEEESRWRAKSRNSQSEPDAELTPLAVIRIAAGAVP